MNAQDGGSQSEQSGDVVTLELRSCPVCETTFPVTAGSTFCPVCMLRLALASANEPGPLHRERAESRPPRETQTFENYELITNDQGQPLELGRGAMGVTYKAFDVDLHCDVTLKVISEKYLGDESARLRFLREARAAAKVRHPECGFGPSSWEDG